MPSTSQIRNVPEDLHRKLKSRAALQGLSLSDYLPGQIRNIAEQPAIEELRARLQRRSAVKSALTTAEIIRAERDRE